MDFSIEAQTNMSGWSIVCIEESQVIIAKTFLFSLKTDFVLAISADTVEMSHFVAFHLGLRCLPKYPFMNFQSKKGEKKS